MSYTERPSEEFISVLRKCGDSDMEVALAAQREFAKRAERNFRNCIPTSDPGGEGSQYPDIIGPPPCRGGAGPSSKLPMSDYPSACTIQIACLHEADSMGLCRVVRCKKMQSERD